MFGEKLRKKLDGGSFPEQINIIPNLQLVTSALLVGDDTGYELKPESLLIRGRGLEANQISASHDLTPVT